MSVLTSAPIVWSSRNLIKILVLLVCVFPGVVGFFSSTALEAAMGTFVGKWSSRNVCQIMLGGLLMMLNMANLTTGAMLRAKGVCHPSALAANGLSQVYKALTLSL
jgi:hypothetical protein